MYQYRHDGKPQKVSLGRYPDLTLKSARDKRDELAAQVVGGRSPAEEKKARRNGRDGDPTMFEFGDRYYREQSHAAKTVLSQFTTSAFVAGRRSVRGLYGNPDRFASFSSRRRRQRKASIILNMHRNSCLHP
jgi:hypothetical protein